MLSVGESTARQVETRIIEAFAGAPKPAFQEIAGNRNTLEARQVAAFLQSRTWNDLTLPVLRGYHGDPSAMLAFLSPKAFRYYLPAFLLAVIRDFRRADMLVDTTLAAVAPSTTLSGSEHLLAHGMEKLSELSLDESNAICAWLGFLNEQYRREFDGTQLDLALEFWRDRVAGR